MKHPSVFKWVKKRLKPLNGKSIGGQVGTQAQELLDQALAISRSPQRNDKEAIHDIRVVLKRLRAYWRLLGYGVDKTLLEAADERVRLAGKKLAGQRDQHVLSDSLHALDDQLSRSQKQWAHTWIDSLESSVEKNHDATVSESDWQVVIECLEAERDVWKSLSGQNLLNHALQKGLTKTLQKNIDLARKATVKKPSTEQRHRWRKWVKYSFYQLKLIKFLGVKVPKSTRRGLNQLGERLGSEHDHSVLNEALQERLKSSKSAQEAVLIEGVIRANLNYLKHLKKEIDDLYRDWTETL